MGCLTRPATTALHDPAEAGDLTAALSCLTGRLPQLLGQLNQWLDSQQQAGRLRADTWSTVPGPAATVQAVTGYLDHAAVNAQRTSDALDAAHQHLAHLAAAPIGSTPADHDGRLADGDDDR